MLMAGGNAEFENERYPKNLIEVNGLPLVELAVRSLLGVAEQSSGLVCLLGSEENRQWHTGDVIRLIYDEAEIVEVPSETGGAACTALLAVEHLRPDEELLIVNGDQVVEADLNFIVQKFRDTDLDGGIVCFPATHPRWSYARLGADGLVVETAEKRPISNRATAGTYWFRQSRDFIEGAAEMIRKEASVGGLYYVCPVFNQLILSNKRVGIFEISADSYHSLADRKGVAAFERALAPSKELNQIGDRGAQYD